MVRGAAARAWVWSQRQSTQHKQSRLRRSVTSAYALPVVVFVAYLSVNIWIAGPAYLSDEVAYLNKASTIAGDTVYASSSWFGGYSLLISPAFWLADNPYAIWNIVLTLNALMWASTAALLQYMLRHTHPRASPRAIRWTAVGTMLYPAWLSMSGYAFATSGFVLVLMAALAAIIKSGFTQWHWLMLAGVLAAYLFWIHPVGIVFVGLLTLLLVAQAVSQRNWRPGAIAVLTVLGAASYLLVVHPWFNRTMSSGFNTNHYVESTSGLLQAITTAGYWTQVGELALGMLFSTLIATFGLAAYGAWSIIQRARQQESWANALHQPACMVMLLSLLAVGGVIAFGALSWGTSTQLRTDQWVYGRYTEMYLLPLIAFGLLASWQRRQTAIIVASVLFVGLLLSLVTNSDNTTAFVNKVNLQALWPMHPTHRFGWDYFWLWGLLGATGIALTAVMGTQRRKTLLAILLVPVAVTGYGNYSYNQGITGDRGAVSSLYQYVKEQYATSECIGFTADADENERFYLYSYYLHDYNLKMMSFEQWQAAGCTGPYLTYDLDAIPPKAMLMDRLTVAGQEQRTGLYVIGHQPTRGSADAIAKESAEPAYDTLSSLLTPTIIFR